MDIPFDARTRPEMGAGGFPRDDEGIAFFTRVNALLRADDVVIDLGAGRGSRFHAGALGFPETLARLQGKVARVIGIDPDEAILEHPFLDERHVVPPTARWPVADASVDVIVSEWVLEHVADTATFAREVERVLKPGGWFCALTPNALGYVGLANQLIPERLKGAIMSRVWPEREDRDVFPTLYRLNTRARLASAFPPSRWEDFSYSHNPTPKYHGNNRLLFALVGLYQTMMPGEMRTNRLVFLRRR